MNLLTESIGFVASLMAFILFIPQAKRTWNVRNDFKAISGVSTGTQWFLLCNAVLWAVYAILTEAFWVGAPGLVNGPLAIVSLILITRARGIIKMRKLEECDLCLSGEKHNVFITEPPGWGSVMSCNNNTRKNGVIVTSEEEIKELRSSRL